MQFKGTSILLAITTLWVAAASCSGAPTPRMEKLPQNAVILAFGNSLTAGTGAGGLGIISNQKAYPAVLEQLTGLTVINAGRPGETAQQGAQRLPSLLRTHAPDLVLLCHGGNDLLRKTSDRQLRKALTAMLRTIEATGAQAVLIAPPQPGLMLHPSYVYEEIAKEQCVPVNIDALPHILGDPDLKSDYIHPNAKGYALLAKEIYHLLKTHGALATDS